MVATPFEAAVVLALVVVGAALAEAVPGVARDLARFGDIALAGSDSRLERDVVVSDVRGDGLGESHVARGTEGGGSNGRGRDLKELEVFLDRFSW